MSKTWRDAYEQYRWKQTTWEYDDACWVQKRQCLKSYDFEIEQMNYWIAQKDIPSSIDLYWRWKHKTEEFRKRKQVTAQTNFEYANREQRQE